MVPNRRCPHVTWLNAGKLINQHEIGFLVFSHPWCSPGITYQAWGIKVNYKDLVICSNVGFSWRTPSIVPTLSITLQEPNLFEALKSSSKSWMLGNGTCHVRPSQQYHVVDLRMYESMTVRCLQARRDPVNYLSKIRYPNWESTRIRFKSIEAHDERTTNLNPPYYHPTPRSLTFQGNKSNYQSAKLYIILSSNYFHI